MDGWMEGWMDVPAVGNNTIWDASLPKFGQINNGRETIRSIE
jgi:hypothetical protein